MNTRFTFLHRSRVGWQGQYARRFQGFLRGKGLNTFEDQVNVHGSRPKFMLPAGDVRKLRHSLGLVATSASASLMRQDQNLAFVPAFWSCQAGAR